MVFYVMGRKYIWFRSEYQLVCGRKENIMSKRYSGKSLKDSSTMKKAKLSIREKRKIKREKKKNKV